MKTIFQIDGGIGRVLTSIPAFLKYAKNHPDDEWYIGIHAWDFCFWGIEELQPRVLHPDTKGIFEKVYLNVDRVIHPEPYILPEYYKNELSLTESFDKIINETDDHSDLPDLELVVSKNELLVARELIGSAAFPIYGDQIQKKKMVVIQPYGSTVTKTSLGFYDKSGRSIPDSFIKEIIESIKDDCIIINMNGGENFSQFENVINIQQQLDIRTWMAIIKQVDYFIGCDSCGQHIAKGVNTPASVFIAGTHEVNVSYPDDFHIIKNNEKFHPVPIRLSQWTAELSERLNEKRMIFTPEERKSHIDEILSRIKGTKKRKTPKSIDDLK